MLPIWVTDIYTGKSYKGWIRCLFYSGLFILVIFCNTVSWGGETLSLLGFLDGLGFNFLFHLNTFDHFKSLVFFSALLHSDILILKSKNVTGK